MALAAAWPPARADAASKYKPCSLLTVADLETELRGKLGRSNERDTTVPEGSCEGEIMSTCDWAVGAAPGAQYFKVNKGLAFGLGGNGSVTVQQVKALADKVAARP
jgi:hypothetical protein